MSFTTIILLLLIGFATGMLSSMVGIGGGIVIVPALMLIFGFSQKMAQGTSLAMLLPPIGILGVLIYHKSGNVNWQFAILLIIAFILGSYFGAKWVQGLNTLTVKRIFAVFMLVMAIKYLFLDKPKPTDEKTNIPIKTKVENTSA
ncbi:MAG: sulfite exporter TauE/SafE family protein [Bacteroidetes bacterium]|nr:sulfite exporter TauE/SafE family protein [Bacteroidota bacterium]